MMADYMQTDPLEILRMQAQEQAAPPTGIMGFLRNPAIRAALQGASQGFAQAANSGVAGKGYALSQGLAGAAQGVGTWEEQQAKAAAERLKMMLDDRRRMQDEQNASMWNTDTGRRYSLKAEQLKREAAAQGKTLADDVAMQMAMDYVDVFPYDQRRAIETLRQNFDREVLGIKQSQKIEEEQRAPEVAAAVATAETTAKADAERAAEIDVKVEKADDALRELQGMERDLAKLPSPVGMRLEDIKAYWGAGNADLQTTIGRIKRRSGAMLRYVDRLPGAATDADREVFMASAGILGSTDPNVSPEQKIGAVRDAIDAYRRLIQKYGNGGQTRQPAATAPKPAGNMSIEDRLAKYR